MIDFRFSSMASRLRRSEIRELLKLTRMPDVISFAGGLPDPAILPYEAVREASNRAIDEHGRHALQYSPSEGEPFFKEQIARFMAAQGEDVKPENIVVVSSSQQALDFLGKVFIDQDDPIVLELPSYVGALQAFRSYTADFHGVTMDDQGIITHALERKIADLCTQGRKPKFIYLIPDFQNPSGITLSLERRKKILELASRYDLLIVEDSPYRELRFTGAPLPSLFSLDSDGRVIYMKTLSKILSPGFRLGWLTGPKPVLEKFVMAKQGADLCTSAFSSIVSACIMESGHLDRQIELSRESYARKSMIMLRALANYMPRLPDLSWSKPEGGMFLWVKLPEYLDAAEMLADAVELKVAYVVGAAFHCDGSGKNTIRLNYSFPTDEQIVEGIRRLSRLVERQLARSTARLTAAV